MYRSNFDTAWLEYIDVQEDSQSVQQLSGWLSSAFGEGSFHFPDSTFLRGDTIRYRIGYILDGKRDSTEWQTYVFLGNFIYYWPTGDTVVVQQFDSIQYPITLGPQDSCGKAQVIFIRTYSVVDTFDYEANWDLMFSDGREYLEPYDQHCVGGSNPLFGSIHLMSYEGDINEAAKAIQRINPVFFLNLVPYCDEYVACEPSVPQYL